jgi:transposase
LPPFVTKNWWLRLLSKEPVIGLEREIWLETCLIPVLKPGQVVVMDNATFHKGGRIEQLIQEAGCELLYLPAYSPDFNKIEQCWSWLKSRIRKQLDQFECLRDAMEYVLHLAS